MPTSSCVYVQAYINPYSYIDSDSLTVYLCIYTIIILYTNVKYFVGIK